MRILSLHIIVQSSHPIQVFFVDQTPGSENKLFVGMLPKTFDDENIYNLFSVYGDLREVHIIRGPEGASKGCAFIKFIKSEAALIAMSDMNDIIPEVCACFVSFLNLINQL